MARILLQTVLLHRLTFTLACMACFLCDARAEFLYVVRPDGPPAGKDPVLQLDTSVVGGNPQTFITLGPDTPHGITFYSGSLYVAYHTTIEKYSTSGADLGTYVSGLDPLTGQVRGIAFDQAGNLYVTQNNTKTIEKITPASASSTFATTTNTPLALTFDAAGNLYVSEGNIIEEFSSSGADLGPVMTFGSTVSTRQLAFDAYGNLFVTTNHGVTAITPKGQHVTIMSGLQDAYGAGFDSAGNFYATDRGANTIQEFTFDSPGALTGTESTFASNLGPVEYLAFESAVQPVPAPPSFTLLAISGAVIAGYHRWRRRGAWQPA